jgi:type II restriction/modification system DNA methylase subunit YeeA
MCRETLRRAVIQKFNDKYIWKCETLDDLKNHLAPRRNTADILEFNSVINSIKICDPAVGSGHFLVSALNELIAIKSELGLLADSTGTVLSGYEAKVENDELIITYNNGEDIFEYHPPKSKVVTSPTLIRRGTEGVVQRVQETLFNEKRTIIENCLFGVDINPNSVKIARLRLWIELLKNAFYTKGSNYTELETLPNIDINIKEGNSLISRFDLYDKEAKILDSTRQKIRLATSKYKEQVFIYKSTNDKATKEVARKNIKQIKDGFALLANPIDKEYKRLKELENNLIQEVLSFDRESVVQWNKKRKKDQDEYDKLKIEYGKKLKTLYSNAFEWRFEFPEALDDNGKFVGFDVVIGNPPYIGFQELTLKEYYNPNYFTAKGKYDIYVLFIELMKKIANSISSNGFILPHKYLVADFGAKTRAFLSKNKFVNMIIHFGEEMAFEDATTYTCITFFSHNNQRLSFIKCKPVEINAIDLKVFQKINYDELSEASWILADDNKSKIIEKVKNAGEKITSIFEGVFQGIVSGDNDAFYLYECEETNNGTILGYSKVLDRKIEFEKEICKPLLSGKNLNKWTINFDNTFIIYPYHLEKEKTILFNQEELKSAYPKTYEYLYSIRNRLNSRGSEKMSYNSWFALWNARNINNLQSKKILTPDICLGTKMSLDSNGDYYHNDTSYVLIKKESVEIPYEYFLGILNSKLIWFFLSNTGNVVRGGYFRFKTKYLEPLSLPIPSKVISQKIIGLVNQIIVAKNKDSQVEISVVESEIDKLVYQLYGLTEEEIKIVEGK